MSNPIKHHFISKFYLNNFTQKGGSKEKLFAYDKIKKIYFQSNPKNICFIKNFNTISYPENKYIIENQLSKIESELSISFKEVINSQTYPSQKQLEASIL